MRVAIIGAGAAGLVAARHASAFNFTMEVFEQTSDLGGTWIYTDHTGVDEFGLPIHTSMYKDLVTNLPKEIMDYPDFKFPAYDRSYITQEQVLKYLHDYAEHFNLLQFIKFRHFVKEVHPLPNDKWSVTVTDLIQKRDVEKQFDAVLVCNGKYSKAILPNIPGMDIFKGRQLHSHDFRKPEMFQNQTVLVIGAGPSGMDITIRVADHASKVILSHRSRKPLSLAIPPEVIIKPEVLKFAEKGVVFKDNTSEIIDSVVFCTGYEFSYPFLTKDCGITIENNYVQSLYKHFLNIERPTMAIIGVPYTVIPFPMFDFQVRLFYKHLIGSVKLPSKEEMILDKENDLNARLIKGWRKRDAHKLGIDFQGPYFDDLANLAQVKPLLPVKLKIYANASMKLMRNVNYKIIDDENFERTIYIEK